MLPEHTLENLSLSALCFFAFSVVFSVTAVEVSLFLALILLFIARHKEHNLSDIYPTLKGSPFFIPWVIYLSVCLLTTITAYYPAKGFGQLNSDFLKYVCLSTLLLTVRKEHLPKLAAVYTTAAAISSIFGIADVATSAIAGDSPVARAGVLMNAVRYGEAMTIAFLLALSLILLPDKDSTDKKRIGYGVAAALILIAVILSQTRGAYLGLATGITVMFGFAAGARKRLAVYTAIMIVGAALIMSMSPTLKGRLAVATTFKPNDYAIDSPNTGISVRLELWKLGYKMFRAHPILGIGPDNVKKVFKKFHPDPFPEEGIYGTLNNLYIHQAAERGILGLGALLLLFGAMLIYAAGRFNTAPSPYTLWAVCALPAFYVVNLTEISFQHVHTSFAIFLSLAMATATGKETV